MNEPDHAPGEVLLKADLFGRVTLHRDACGGGEVRRNLRAARWWSRPLARWLARREARALRALDGLEAVPRLLSFRDDVLVRSYLPGEPMQKGRPRRRSYYRGARRLMIRLHRCGVVHNDLAKEPNWLVTADGAPALVDFQLSTVFRRRGWRFRLMAREDLRHLLKHKRTYCAQDLTPRERRILATPSWPARLWRGTGKRLYLVVTRGLFRWQDREGAGDRQFPVGEAEERNTRPPAYTAGEGGLTPDPPEEVP